MASISPSTWNTLGLGVAFSWSVLSAAAIFSPHRTAELFGIRELSDSRTTNPDSALGFSGMIGSRDLTIALSIFLLARKGRNEDAGAVILSTMCICLADILIVLRRQSYVELSVLAIGTAIYALVGLGLRGKLG